MSKLNYTRLLYVAFFFLGLFLLSSYTPINFRYSYDGAFYRYLGFAISQGELPYREVFDNKPPLLYYLGALAASISTVWGYFIVMTACVMGSAFYYLKVFSHLSGVGALTSIIFYIYLLTWTRIRNDFFDTRTLASAMGIGILALLFYSEKQANLRATFRVDAFQQPNRGVNFLIGLLLGNLFFTHQTLLLPYSILAIYWVFTTEKIHRIKTFLDGLLGVVVGLAFWISLLLYHGIWNDFIFHVYTVNFLIYPSRLGLDRIAGFSDLASTLWHHGIGQSLVLLLGFDLSVRIITKKTQNDRLRIATWLFLFFSLFEIAWIGRVTTADSSFWHHMIPLSVPFCLALLLSASSLENLLPNKTFRFAAAPILGMFVYALLWRDPIQNKLHYFTAPFRSKSDWVFYKTLPSWHARFEEMRGKPRQFFGLGEFLGINIGYEILSPVGWPYDHNWGGQHGGLFEEKMGSWESILIPSLEKYKTRYVVAWKDEIDFEPRIMFLYRYLLAHYHPVEKDLNTKAWLWERNH